MKRLVIATLVVAFLTGLIAPVEADQLSEAKNNKTAVDSRISKLKSDKNKALEEKAKLEKQKQQLADAQTAEKNAYNEIVSQIEAAEENLKETEAALKEAEAIYNQKQELFKTRLRVMYQNSGTTKLDMLIESKSLVEFYERLQYMSVLAKNDSEIVEDLNTAKQDVEVKKQQQEHAKELLEEKKSEKQQKLTKLKTSRAEVEGELTRSEQELKKLEADIDKQIEESQRLNSVIKNLSTSKKKYAGGSMTWPLPSSYKITSSYGMRKHPILRKYKMHTGIDIAGSYGSSIVAANKGTVIIAKYDTSGGYGNMVVIDHGGGITTLYGHASKLCVKVGQEVKAGQTIAKVGSTGLATGNHLHFEIRVNGATINPLSGGYLSK